MSTPTMDQISAVYDLTTKQREDLARPVLDALRAIPAEYGRDGLGIAMGRVMRLYESVVERTTHSVQAIACARHAMVREGAENTVAICAVERAMKMLSAGPCDEYARSLREGDAYRAARTDYIESDADYSGAEIFELMRAKLEAAIDRMRCQQ